MTETFNRAAAWIDLLERVAGDGDAGIVWKNVEAGLAGSGDVDLMAPRSAWPGIEAEFRAWAHEHGLGPVAACRHVPGTLYLIAIDSAAREFLQLDVKDRATFRGATVVTAERLASLGARDRRGFTRLSPGAEGLLKLVINGTAPGGRPHATGLAKERVSELLRGDPDGARAAAALLGPAATRALAGASAASSGAWDRAAMAAVESLFVAKAVTEPAVAWGRLAARRAKKRCPVIKASLRNGRRVPEDVDAWVALVAETHAVFRDAPAPQATPHGRGAVLSVVGPDGSGKTTLIDALLEGPLAGRPIMRVRKVGTLPRRTLAGIAVTEPHKDPPYPFPLSYAKTAYVFVDYFLGWWLRIRPFVRAGGWVIVERGWWDIAVDPRRYRMRTPSRLLWALGRLQPLPDLLLVLEASPEVIHARKTELSLAELERQMQAWRRDLPAKQRRVFIDASRPLLEVVSAGQAEVERLLASSARPQDRSQGGPRFTLPAGPRPAARTGLRVYHPVTLRGLAGWALAGAVVAAGGRKLLPVGDEVPEDVARVLDGQLDPGIELAVAKANHPGRFVALGVDPGGGLLWAAKIATDAPGRHALENEARAVSELAPRLPEPISPPRLIRRAEGLLVFEPVEWRPRTRPWVLPEEVAAAAGLMFQGGLGHGDFAPWNLYRTATGWTLLDWEEATAHPRPFEDPLHYLVQAHALLGRPSRAALLAALDGRGWAGRALSAYARAAGFGLHEARVHLPGYLRASMAQLDPSAADGRAGIEARRALLAELAS